MGFKDWKLCEGCGMFDPPYSCRDGGNPIFNERRCPCIDCLLKVMCDKVCEDFAKYMYETKQIKINVWKGKTKSF